MLKMLNNDNQPFRAHFPKKNVFIVFIGLSRYFLSIPAGT